jgi:hypothetical protein
MHIGIMPYSSAVLYLSSLQACAVVQHGCRWLRQLPAGNQSAGSKAAGMQFGSKAHYHSIRVASHAQALAMVYSDALCGSAAAGEWAYVQRWKLLRRCEQRWCFASVVLAFVLLSFLTRCCFVCSI